MSDRAAALLEELNLGSARGGKRQAAEVLQVDVVRSLGEEDLPLLVAPPPVMSPPQRLVTIRHAHHQLAQLLAKGTEQVEAALITGYSQTYISTIKHDQAFNELIEYYRAEREAVFVDTLERMRVLGLSTLDELQARLTENAQEWSRRELMEMAELMLLKPHQVRQQPSGGGGTPAVNVNVKFVTAQQQSQVVSEEMLVSVVDLEYEDVDGGSVI
jgi:hypothetical protein